jgi:hypothetical protein
MSKKEEDKFHGDFGSMTPEEQDAIINPKHYKILSEATMLLFLNTGMEYMDIMRYALSKHKGVIAHVLGQVFKYSFRLGGKDDALQDAKKIAWYGNRLVEEIEFERGITKLEPRGEYPKDPGTTFGILHADGSLTPISQNGKHGKRVKKQTVDEKLRSVIVFMENHPYNSIAFRPFIQDLREAKEFFKKEGVTD